MPTALFRTDASSRLGGGHVMRCTTLARALQEQGITCTFAGTAETEQFLMHCPYFSFPFIRLPYDPTAEIALLTTKHYDLLVLDHYHRDHQYEQQCRRFARRLLVLDDNPDRPHDCDILLDQNFGRTAAHYQGLVPPHTVFFTGTDYCLLRPEFLHYGNHPANLPAQASRILLTMGAADGDNMTGQLLDRLTALSGFHYTILIGPSNPHRPQFEGCDTDRLTFLFSPPNIPELMATTDLAITSLGGTCWELAFMQVPMLIVPLSPLQQQLAETLAKQRAALLAKADTIVSLLASVAGDDTVRRELAANARRLCDGNGAAKIAQFIKEFLHANR